MKRWKTFHRRKHSNQPQIPWTLSNQINLTYSYNSKARLCPIFHQLGNQTHKLNYKFSDDLIRYYISLLAKWLKLMSPIYYKLLFETLCNHIERLYYYIFELIMKSLISLIKPIKFPQIKYVRIYVWTLFTRQKFGIFLMFSKEVTYAQKYSKKLILRNTVQFKITDLYFDIF